MNNISDPLERIRHTTERAIESGEKLSIRFREPERWTGGIVLLLLSTRE